MVRKRIIFTGRVQGVGFRATAAAIARRHPVTGWVRNQHDGSVLLEVQGDQAAVEAYLADLRARMGRLIQGTDDTDLPADSSEADFEVRR